MKLFWLFDRIRNKIKRKYRHKVFKEMINCSHNDFSIVGDITVINRNIKLGHNVTIYPDVMFFGDGLIEIGDNVDIGNGTLIYSSKSGGISIGNNSVIAAQCYIIDMDHGMEKEKLIREQNNTAAKVTIGEDCWIAANVTVLKGSQINDGAVVGAKSLVKGNVESNSIVVGAPCRKIKMRE